MISFDDFTNDGGSVNLSPIYNSISILSNNTNELYTMITNIPTGNKYMKAYNSTDGDYQYNISGSINNELISIQKDIEGNYSLNSCTFSHYSHCLKGDNIKENSFSGNNCLNINAKTMISNTFSNVFYINFDASYSYISNYNIYNYIALLSGYSFNSNTFTSNRDISIKCYAFNDNSIVKQASLNLNAFAIYPNTFNSLTRLNMNWYTIFSNSNSTLSFNNISTLQLNKYIRTSNSVVYNNIVRYVLGHPEDLFDSNKVFTQTELDSKRVYLSEVPVSLLGGNGGNAQPYMKAYNSTDGNYQYNISGSINSLVFSNTYDNIEGNYTVSSCTFNDYSRLDMNLKTMSGNLCSSNKLINLLCVSNKLNTYSIFTSLNVHGYYFSSNIINNAKICDINCPAVYNNSFVNKYSNNIKCNELYSNIISDSGFYDISVVELYWNTFSNLTRLNINYINSNKSSIKPYIFNSISTLQLNKYIPTSNNVSYANITNFILGHPEELFDSNKVFTQTELDSNKVYLSEVPVSLLGGNGTTNITYSTPYMKSLDTTLNYQYNISGLWDSDNSPELRITNSIETQFQAYINGNNSICEISIPATPYNDSTIPMRWNITCNEFNSNSLTSSNQHIIFDAYSLNYNSFNSIERLNLKADEMLWNKFNTIEMGEITANTFSKNSFTSVFSLDINANNIMQNTWDNNKFLNINAYGFNSNLLSTGSFMTIKANNIKNNTFIQSEVNLQAELISGNSLTKPFNSGISFTMNSITFNCRKMYNNTISGWALVDLFHVNSFGNNSSEKNKLYWNQTIRMQDFLTWYEEGEYSDVPFIPWNYIGDHASLAPALNYDLSHIDLEWGGVIENGVYHYTGPWYRLYGSNLPTWTSETITSLNIFSNGVPLTNLVMPTITFH